MMTRRKFITTAAVAGVGAAGGLGYLSYRKSMSQYEDAVRQIWRHGEPGSGDVPAVLRDLVRYATLAP